MENSTKDKIYVTLLDSELKFNDFQYVEGLNTVPRLYPESNNILNKIIFVEKENINKLITFFFVHKYDFMYLAVCHLPESDPQFKKVTYNDLRKTMYCANMICVDEIHKLDNIEIFEKLKSVGCDISASNIETIAFKTHSNDLVKSFLPNKKSDLSFIKDIIDNNMIDIIFEMLNDSNTQKALKNADSVAMAAAGSRNIDLVKILVDKYGVNPEIFVNNSVYYSNIKFIEYLISIGLDKNVIFFKACEKEKKKVVEFLIMTHGINAKQKLIEYQQYEKTSHKYTYATPADFLKQYICDLEKSENIPVICDENITNGFLCLEKKVHEMSECIESLKQEINHLKQQICLQNRNSN